MEIPARNDVGIHVLGFRIAKDQWIVDGRIRLSLKDRAAMRQRVAHRAMHLRHAAQRVSILHACAITMRFAYGASFEQPAQIGGGRDLSGVRASAVNPLIESSVCPLERIASHRSNHVCRIDQNLRRQQGKRSHCQHRLRAINQRNRFLRLQHQRLDPRSLEGHGPCRPSAFPVVTLALADQQQRQVCQRREVARSSHAALRGYPRCHAARQ